MAKSIRKRNCLNCQELFQPDHRNVKKQEYCSKPECRKASKTAAQARWLAQKQNQDYFRGPENVQRVREWRNKNSGYWRRNRAKSQNALQDHLIEEKTKKQDIAAHLTIDALQDYLTAQHAVLVGLIANLTGNALQDDIAQTTDHLQKLGSDILSSLTLNDQGGSYVINPPYLPRSSPSNSETVQLGRRSSGSRSPSR